MSATCPHYSVKCCGCGDVMARKVDNHAEMNVEIQDHLISAVKRIVSVRMIIDAAPHWVTCGTFNHMQCTCWKGDALRSLDHGA